MNALCAALYLKYLCHYNIRVNKDCPDDKLMSEWDAGYWIGYFVSPATKAAIDALESRK